MKLPSDKTILQWLRDEHTLEKGFSVLMEKYQERLYWHIRRMVVHHEDANDVIQNTFIKVFRNISSFQGKSALYTWLYRIGTNEALTFLDKRKRKQADSLDDAGYADWARQLQSDPYFDGEEAHIQLQFALKQLPPKQQVVFNMRYFDNMTYKEISAVLDTSVGALKASYHHAVKKIEKTLTEKVLG